MKNTKEYVKMTLLHIFLFLYIIKILPISGNQTASKLYYIQYEKILSNIYLLNKLFQNVFLVKKLLLNYQIVIQ
jgi:hypothetical protein